MAGESAHFGLRERPPTPAIRPFELPPRMRPMLDRAHSGLAEPFRGVAIGGEVVPGLFRLGQTGISTAPVVEAARSFLVGAEPRAAERGELHRRGRGLAEMVEHPSVADASRRLPRRSRP